MREKKFAALDAELSAELEASSRDNIGICSCLLLQVLPFAGIAFCRYWLWRVSPFAIIGFCRYLLLQVWAFAGIGFAGIHGFS